MTPHCRCSRLSLPIFLFLVTLVPPSGALLAADEKLQLDKIRLPEGFHIELYAEQVPGARSLTRSDRGVIYAGTMRAGKVYAITDDDSDFVADKVQVILEGLFMPNGVAFRDGSLYVAEVNRVLRYDQIDQRLADPPEPVVVTDTLPSDRHHGWKFIRFGPDGKLYVPVGAPCNICDKGDPYAAIHRMDPDGSDQEVFVRGVRNTVGFDWHPQSGELWFTDNGRDMLGDDVPADELNRVREPGMHFGYPYCHATGVADPEFGKNRSCEETVAPARELGPHVAAIGMRFYTGQQFPAEYRNQIFIAEHGSWNRTQKSGYRVMTVRVDDQGMALSYEPFAEGWLQGEKAWGRPSDVLVMHDGSLLVSDDMRGVIYRIAYEAAPSAVSGR